VHDDDREKSRCLTTCLPSCLKKADHEMCLA
jgi:hypothetical protein